MVHSEPFFHISKLLRATKAVKNKRVYIEGILDCKLIKKVNFLLEVLSKKASRLPFENSRQATSQFEKKWEKVFRLFGPY